MSKFKVNTEDIKISSINRTIRMKPEHFEKIMELSEKTGVSFNKIVNQCIEYALANIDEN
ncbi:ribbon-helix-helix domain-containing protein [Christensenellaceae bacterium OttesenSCG-928-K19]|nr:ribbon-helix-helix domain-containing protein [Christensenellaceae bacterium OttesenSCG-928-K19]